ncbi:hypothetical protein GC089_07435 [Cellulomonas sp. JZ18]|uniref:hypothetical protein n=1 Tax=Cellulomonas sp. JZ18 TaxID=2654191 RepID=UPI0012D381D8|nr:hypothetical protein [Cellulomonas sp. JZ18]QGQ19089.1 hypothetical protein GC089_07435 [Cellulomonas sp. JZ18]
MHEVETVIAQACASHLAAGRLRLVESHVGDHGVPACTAATDRLTLLAWVFHGELDGNLRSTAPGTQPLDLRRALRHLGADWGSTWNREGIASAFAQHLDRLDHEAADAGRWEAFRAAVQT